VKRVVLVPLLTAVALLPACWKGSSGGEDAGTGADTDVDADTDADTETEDECVPEQYQQCGADGHVHWFDSCDVQGELVEECPPENMLCVDTSETTAECQCLPSHTGPECEQVCVRYVDVDATGDPLNDGLSWETAFADPRAGIDSASAAALSDPEFDACEVWVVKGTYYAYVTSREDTFRLLDDVLVFGGFNGDETARSERDWQANETVLDGRGGPDGDVRVYHVVRALGDGRLDGITITGGLADETDNAFNQRGAGIDIDGTSPTIANCTIAENEASYGAGLAIFSNGAPLVTGCTIARNEAEGAVVGDSANPIFRGCRIVENSSNSCVSGINFGGGSAGTIVNCVFADQTSDIYFGRGIALHGEASVNIINSTFGDGECCHAALGGELTIVNSVILNSWQEFGIGEDTPQPAISYSALMGPYPYEGEGNIDPDDFGLIDPYDGDFQLEPGSPLIDAANGEVAPEVDILGNPRVDDPDTPNTGIGPPWADIGAYELQPE
jgi:hypothetical protein